jgi:hypothetical protein
MVGMDQTGYRATAGFGKLIGPLTTPFILEPPDWEDAR